MKLADLRSEYMLAGLDESDTAADPFAQFDTWFSAVLGTTIALPNSVMLATATANGRPSVRAVLLKGVDPRGFVFFTNYASRKGRELEQNPQACLLFCWEDLERQIRIEGRVERISAAESDEYFASRPLGSRIGAWASPQSEAVASREVLESRVKDMATSHGDNPPRPPHWGGYRVLPELFEFWQGRKNRLHDRIVYLPGASGTWTRSRIAP